MLEFSMHKHQRAIKFHINRIEFFILTIVSECRHRVILHKVRVIILLCSTLQYIKYFGTFIASQRPEHEPDMMEVLWHQTFCEHFVFHQRKVNAIGGTCTFMEIKSVKNVFLPLQKPLDVNMSYGRFKVWMIGA